MSLCKSSIFWKMFHFITHREHLKSHSEIVCSIQEPGRAYRDRIGRSVSHKNTGCQRTPRPCTARYPLRILFTVQFPLVRNFLFVSDGSQRAQPHRPERREISRSHSHKNREPQRCKRQPGRDIKPINAASRRNICRMFFRLHPITFITPISFVLS